MDEMKLNLTTKFMRGVLARIISRKIKKQYGYKIDIHFDEIKLDMFDGHTYARVHMDLNLSSEDFKKLMLSIDKD